MEDRKRDIFNNNLKSSVEVAVSHSHDEKKENAAAQRKNGPKKKMVQKIIQSIFYPMPYSSTFCSLLFCNNYVDVFQQSGTKIALRE